MSKPKRHAVKKDAGVPNRDLLSLMPLANRHVAPGSLVFKATHAELHIGNLEQPLAWRLDVVRKAAEPAAIADAFAPIGSRYTRTLKDVPAALLDEVAEAAPGATIAGMTELGLQADDDHEYFLSKFGELCGVIRVQRKADGSWKAGLAKTNLPRVLSKEAVDAGLMPPPGSSGLPKSLESVVPEEFRYWAQKDAQIALQMRNDLVSSGFFTEDAIKPVDGELRKVVTRHFIYDPATDAAPKAASFSSAAGAVVPDALQGKGYTPMAEDDWLEKLDEGDAPGKLAILSPPDRAQSAIEMARAVKTLKGDFLIEHDDTRANRAALSGLGVLFKLDAIPDRVFCSSFAPACDVQKLEDTVKKTVEFQGIKIDIDRPKGFVQTGKDADGNEWSREYLYDYGFFPGTQGGDGDQLDVFVGPSGDSKRVFWVTQNKADGSFDEYKVFLGFDTARDARDCFTSHIPAKFYAGMNEIPMGTLKSLLGVEPSELAKRIAKASGFSFEQVRQAVNAALDEAYPKEQNGDSYPCGSYIYVDDLYDDQAVFCKDGKTWSVGYTFDGGKATLSGSPVQVVRTYKPITEVGVQNSEPSAGDPPDEEELDPQLPNVKRMSKAVAEIRKRAIMVKGAVKKDGDERYVLGVVLEPDVVDAQQDTYSADEVRGAAEKFMENFRNMGLMHKQIVNEKVKILESYIAPTDMTLEGGETVKKGTWMMAVRVIDDGLWKAVKGGQLTGFSIGGSAIRKPVSQDV